MWCFVQALLGLTVLGSALVNSQEDPCVFYPTLISPGSRLMKVDIPQKCMSGGIEWDYPMDNLYIIAYRQDAPFRLCLESDWGAIVGNMKDLTGGVNKTIPLPGDSQPSCTREDAIGNTTILIQPTPNRRYWSSFQYRIDFLQ